MKSIFFFLFFLVSTIGFSQIEAYEYLGVIKLNDTSFIPYKLAFEEIDGQILGYSIVYTKSPISELDMCLVNFKGKMRNLKKTKAFSGEFQGFYPDNSSCLNGMVILTASERIMERITKLDEKIQKSKRYSQEVKNKVSAKRAVDTLTMSVVRKDENLNVFTKNKKVIVSIHDSGKVDNDRINLYVDNVLILENYTIKKEKKQIPIEITKQTTIVRVEAIDEGTSAPNTVKVEIQDGQSLITTRTSLKTGETAALSLIKN